MVKVVKVVGVTGVVRGVVVDATVVGDVVVVATVVVVWDVVVATMSFARIVHRRRWHRGLVMLTALVVVDLFVDVGRFAWMPRDGCCRSVLWRLVT